VYRAPSSYAVQVDILPGVLLTCQGGRRSKDFRVLQQQTHKQNKASRGAHALAGHSVIWMRSIVLVSSSLWILSEPVSEEPFY